MVKPTFQNLAKSVKQFFAISESSVLDTQQEIETYQSPKIGIDKVYFLHLRMRAENGTIMPWGGATIAYKVVKELADEVADPADDNNNLYFIDVGIANCKYSDKHRDLFCKRIGRDIAMARLLDFDRVDDGGALTHHPTHAEVIHMVKEAFYQKRELVFPTIRAVVR